MTEVKEKEKVGIEKIESTGPNEVKKETPKKKEQKGEIQLRRYRPLSLFTQFDHFFDEMDRYFKDIWRPSRFWDFKPFNLSIFNEDKFFRTPLTNIVENENDYSITAELPGLDKGDIKITIHDGVLEIEGKQKKEREEKKDGFVRREYHSSSYHRRFTIPENIDGDKIDAKLDKGVLTLKLPKKEVDKKEKKQIEVK